MITYTCRYLGVPKWSILSFRVESELLNVGFLVNYCMITFSDNTEVAYLKTLTKEDIIKFYKVNSVCILRFWLVRKYRMCCVMCLLLLWAHSGRIYESVFMDGSVFEIVRIEPSTLFFGPGTVRASGSISFSCTFVCSFCSPAHRKILLSLFGGQEEQRKQ